MKNIITASFIFICSFYLVVANEINPISNDVALDTLKSYYLDEIVVTSSVKETNELKYLPTAVSVISPKQLQDSRIESLPGLSAYIPNFFIPSYGSKVSTPIYIRGVGARLGSQTVSLYVDNVPSFNPSSFDFEFQDVQRVEVLRGAQGTLYGRNAIGGIVNIYTLSPLTYQGTRLMVGGGNYGQLSVKGSDYRKIGDAFGVSVAGYYKRDNGYFMNKYSDDMVDASENAGARIKLEWQVAPSFKASLFGNYDRVSGGAFPYMHIDSTESNFNDASQYGRHLFTNGLSLNYTGNGYSVHSTTGFQYLKDNMDMDQDYSPKSIFSINQQQEQHSLSQEVTIKSDFDGRYRWVMGVFGFYDRREVNTPVTLKEDMVGVLQGHLDSMMDGMGAPLRLVYESDNIYLPGIYIKPSRGVALFHQSSLDNIFGVDGLSATAGIRFDYEHTGLDYFTESKGGNVNTMSIPPRYIEGDTVLEGSLQKEFWEILPKFALKYRMSPTSQIYLSASKGYKTGGYNEQVFSEVLQSALTESLARNVFAQIPPGMPIPVIPPSGDSPTVEEQVSYDPETSWTYELGGRYEMLDRRLSFTYALFYTQVDNLQITKLVSEGTAGRTIANAGKSESKGVELSLKYMPLNNLSLFAEYGFADARFVKYDTEEVIGGDTIRSFAGNFVPFAPRHTMSLGVSYVHRFSYGSAIESIAANIQYAGVGRIYWTESNKDSNGQELYQPFYGLTNASVVLERGVFGLECWVENIFNTEYNSFLFEQDDVITKKTNTLVQRGYPPRFGVTLRYNIYR